jgi:CBS domain-containing protein
MTTRKVLDARVAGTKGEFPQHPRVAPLTVKSVLKNHPPAPQCLRADDTVRAALKIMAEHDIGAVPVMDGVRLIGIFSERDYARCSTWAAQPGMTTPLREVMTACTLFANLTDSVQECLRLMLENRARYLPIQEEGNLIALLSIDDLLGGMVAYLERVFKENELDRQIVSLRGTYSC